MPEKSSPKPITKDPDSHIGGHVLPSYVFPVGSAAWLAANAREKKPEVSTGEVSPIVASLALGFWTLVAAAQTYSNFPNETVIGVAGVAATTVAATKDWFGTELKRKLSSRIKSIDEVAVIVAEIKNLEKKSNRIKIITATLTAAAFSYTGYCVFGNPKTPEGILPQFLEAHAGLCVDTALGAGVLLYPKAIWKNKFKLAALPFALTLLAGGVEGIHDGVVYQERDPFKVGDKAFADVAHVTSKISKHLVVSEVPGQIVAVPAFAGGFVGSAVNTAYLVVTKKLSEHPGPSQPQALSLIRPQAANALALA